ncbi:hypothetical protein H5410_018313 [Solanum commersonii]|uniref:ELM2 domain-containing protein n=1 Tax=Solanum commersonii TaxID=4109 RepID=A0A9J6A1S4_SOLCO|nr:hypothetical protein H5410_018313 [Solanum commersonii]
MVQKGLLVIEEDLYEVSSKQPIRHEPNCQLVPVLKLLDNSSKIIPDANKKFDSHIVAAVLFSSEMGIHGSVSNSSWPTSSTSEEDIRPESPFHILTSSEYYYFDHSWSPIGPDFQAELPEWTPYSDKDKPCIEGIHETLSPPSQANENELAKRTIIPMPKMELLADQVENIGERRV